MKPFGDNLAGYNALVVGGSGGIGSCASRALAEAGANLVVHGGHRKDALEKVAAECRGHGVSCTTLLKELNDSAAVDALLDSGVPDILVVAFGPIRWVGVSDETPGGWRDMLLLNLAIPGALVSACLPDMKKRGFGRLILFGASRGDVAPPSSEATAYTAAKSGLVSLARSVAKDGAAHNVSCNILCPGYVDTEYLDGRQRALFTRRAPTGRLTDPENIGGFVTYLCGTAGRVINGAVINAGEGIV